MRYTKLGIGQNEVCQWEKIMRDSADTPLVNDLCFLLQRGNRVISRGANAALITAGLTVEQTLLLAAIAEVGSTRATDLSRSLGLDASTIAANLKPLIRRNLVSVVDDVVDRRARSVSLTSSGLAKLDLGIRHLHQYERALIERAGRELGIQNLCDTLDRVAKACS